MFFVTSLSFEIFLRCLIPLTILELSNYLPPKVGKYGFFPEICTFWLNGRARQKIFGSQLQHMDINLSCLYFMTKSQTFSIWLNLSQSITILSDACLSSFLNALTCCSLWPYRPQNTSIHGGIFCKWCFSIRVQTGPYESYDISHNFILQQWIVFTGINELKSSFRAVSSQSFRLH